MESEQGQSYDIASDLDYICHRRRSNTAQRLDRLKKEKINQSKTLTIMWRCPSPSHSLEQSQKASTEINKSKDNLLANKARSPPTKSGLTRLLEKFPSLPKNPFDEYAQFDGGMSESVPVKKIMIFIPFSQDKQHCNETETEKEKDNSDRVNQQQVDTSKITSTNSNEAQNLADKTKLSTKLSQEQKAKNSGPLEVVIVSTATVQDLIGLICWQYTNEGREPKLHYDLNRYCLRIAEDNGEVDPDFSSLNPKEPLSKFNFPLLALTEKTEDRVRNFNDQYANGSIYTHSLPTLAPDVITKSNKSSKMRSKFAAFTRIIFKDAKLDASQ